MEVKFTPEALKDLAFWKETNNTAIQKKISKLLESIVKTPFEGIGQPEPLKYQAWGTWSRRITKEHRLVYLVENDLIYVLSLRYHYTK
jgi:toxin YoeB